MRVVITGAAGQIGTQIIGELSRSHDLCLIDLRPVTSLRSIVANLSQPSPLTGWRSWVKSKPSQWIDAFKNAEVVVHLVASMLPLAPWKEVLPNNIQATWNVLEEAAKHHVPRVVFASSNWAVKAMEQRLAPECYRHEGPKINSFVDPCPVNPYGVSKAFGEFAGRMFVDEGRFASFIAVRIGNYNLRPPEDEILSTRWIGADDIRTLFRRCVEANLEGFHVVYGVSAQATAPYDLSQTAQTLSWFPRAMSRK